VSPRIILTVIPYLIEGGGIGQIRVEQNREPPQFLSLLNGAVVVHKGIDTHQTILFGISSNSYSLYQAPKVNYPLRIASLIASILKGSSVL